MPPGMFEGAGLSSMRIIPHLTFIDLARFMVIIPV